VCIGCSDILNIRVRASAGMKQTVAEGKFDLFSECCLHVSGEALNQTTVGNSQPL